MTLYYAGVNKLASNLRHLAFGNNHRITLLKDEGADYSAGIYAVSVGREMLRGRRMPAEDGSKRRARLCPGRS